LSMGHSGIPQSMALLTGKMRENKGKCGNWKRWWTTKHGARGRFHHQNL
jgi:hypothetical protein